MRQLLFACAFLLSINSYADIFDLYVGAAGNYEKLNIDYKEGKTFEQNNSDTGLNYFAGIKFAGFRLDVEKNGIKNDNFTNSSLGYNAYAHIPFPLPLVSPYLGVGLNELKIHSTSKNRTHYIVGLYHKLPLLPISLSAEYRYSPPKQFLNTEDYKVDIGYNSSLLKIAYEF